LTLISCRQRWTAAGGNRRAVDAQTGEKMSHSTLDDGGGAEARPLSARVATFGPEV
jgi:hypothetical protein